MTYNILLTRFKKSFMSVENEVPVRNKVSYLPISQLSQVSMFPLSVQVPSYFRSIQV